MGYLGLEEPSPAKLAKIAADQQRPEFRQWLASMDSGLNTLFTEDIPDLPDDPYTPDGLRCIEEFANAYFHQRESQRNWLGLSEQIERYLGELVVRTVEGEWKYINLTGEGLIPVVQMPFRISYFAPAETLQTALSEHTGDVLNWIYGQLTKNYAAWNKQGRLPLPEWVEFQSEQRRGLR